MAAVLGLSGKLDELTATNFAPHTNVFDGYAYEIIQPADEKGSPTLVVKNAKNKKKQLSITPNTNIVKLGKKGDEEVKLHSVVVYVDANQTFYLPQTLTDYLK
jgi:alkaline phosphatase